MGSTQVFLCARLRVESDPGWYKAITIIANPGMHYSHVEFVIQVMCKSVVAERYLPRIYEHRQTGCKGCVAHVCITVTMDTGAYYTVNSRYSGALDKYELYQCAVPTSHITEIMLRIRPILRCVDNVFDTVEDAHDTTALFNSAGFYLGHAPLISIFTRLKPESTGIVYIPDPVQMLEQVSNTRKVYCSELVLGIMLCIPFFNDSLRMLRQSDIMCHIEHPGHATPDDVFLLFKLVTGGVCITNPGYLGEMTSRSHGCWND